MKKMLIMMIKNITILMEIMIILLVLLYQPQDALPDREINLEIRPTQLGVQPCSNENVNHSFLILSVFFVVL